MKIQESQLDWWINLPLPPDHPPQPTVDHLLSGIATSSQDLYWGCEVTGRRWARASGAAGCTLRHPACVWHHPSRCPQPGPHPDSEWWQNGGLLPIIQASQLLPRLRVAAMQSREPQAPGRQETVPGRGNVVREAKPHGIQAPLSHWTSHTEHKFKVKIIKNLKTAITELFIPSTRLSECKVQCTGHLPVKPTLRLIPVLVQLRQCG